MNDTPIDLAIIGGGPVGTALALLVAARSAHPERIVVIDRQTEAAAQADPRVIALSEGSLQILARVAPIREMAAAPITRIHVSQAGHLGRTVMQASELGLRAFGAVARYGEIMRVLGSALAHSGVQVRRPVAVGACGEDADGAHWTEHAMAVSEAATHSDLGAAPAHDQAATRAAIVAHAEGGLFRREAGHAAPTAPDTDERRDYDQSAVISEIDCEHGHGGIAYERFAAHGPIALLPLPEPTRCALVWCERPAIAAEIAQLDEAAFLARLQSAFGHRAGRFLRATPPQAYALGLMRHRDQGQRIVRIGNAAQAVHPVTGQGLNLGLRDAFALAQACTEFGATPEAIAHMRAQRRTDRWATVRITDALARGFALPFSPLRHLAGAGLFALDVAAPLRAALARQMMFGVRD